MNLLPRSTMPRPPSQRHLSAHGKSAIALGGNLLFSRPGRELPGAVTLHRDGDELTRAGSRQRIAAIISNGATTLFTVREEAADVALVAGRTYQLTFAVR